MVNRLAKGRTQRVEDVADSLYARFFSGFADETRLRIIRALLDGPHTVGEIVAQLGMSQSRISNQLACLRWCGFVRVERKGKFMIYELAHRDIAKIVSLAQRLVSRNAEHIAQCAQL
jgi:DNA-binding transcriptional ArsR family regulator